MSVSSSTLTLRRLRKMPTRMARPTAASAAATAMTMKAKTCAVRVVVRAREREQRQVGGVELQLDAHQHDERVAAQDARRATPIRNSTATSIEE